jgi:cytochrome P450
MSSEKLREGPEDATDSLDALNAGFGHDVVKDPYPRLAELRSQGDVHIGNLQKELGIGSDLLAVGQVEGDCYLVLGHETTMQVMRDGRTFSSAGYQNSAGLVLGHTMLEMDDPEHGQYRKVVSPSFSRRSMEQWSSNITTLANQLVDKFAPTGRAELVRDFAFEYPISVIASILGLPEADLPEFQREAIIIIDPTNPRALEASRWLGEYFARIVAQRRTEPGDDLVSVLVDAEIDGERLDDEAIYSLLRLLLPAGAETTFRSTANLVYGLLTNPEQLEAVQADRSLVPNAVEEAVRWQPPFISATRTATRDVEIAGTVIPKGGVVVAYLGSANRDERVFPNPDAFDIRREPAPHVAYAAGPHLCLGMHLARLEMAIALNTMLNRLPGLRLDPDDTDGTDVMGFMMRSPARLPVLFDPQPV